MPQGISDVDELFSVLIGVGDCSLSIFYLVKDQVYEGVQLASYLVVGTQCCEPAVNTWPTHLWRMPCSGPCWLSRVIVGSQHNLILNHKRNDFEQQSSRLNSVVLSPPLHLNSDTLRHIFTDGVGLLRLVEKVDLMGIPLLDALDDVFRKSFPKVLPLVVREHIWPTLRVFQIYRCDFVDRIVFQEPHYNGVSLTEIFANLDQDHLLPNGVDTVGRFLQGGARL